MSESQPYTSRKTSRLWIPHTSVSDCLIAGDLEQLEPERGTHGRKVALILHGTMGHKDYLFQRRLALALPIDSFRFDFRGNNETPGIWSLGSIGEDLVDLKVVVQYLSTKLGYTIDLIVGHSKGSLVAFRWLCTTDEGRRVSQFVNVSARYRMEKVQQRIRDRLPEYISAFESQGYFEWKLNVARKPMVGIIYPKDVDKFAEWDSTIVWDQFPQHTHVLTIQGLKDQTVPPYDAIIYARALSSRSPGTHNLHVIEDGDHNFVGHYGEVVEAVLDWLSAYDKGELRTGIWGSGMRGKL